MNHLTEHGLRKTLSDLPLGGIRFLKQTGSTNDVALAWAAEGAADLSLVVAEEQTAGRGRFGRKWVTPPGTALAFSLILRPRPVERDVIPLYSALGALAIATTLEEKYTLKPEIKWPNDVLLARRKVSGILAEAVWLENQAESVVLGIGLNVRAEAIPSAESFSFPAISLETATGRSVDRLSLLDDILTALIAWRPRLGCGEFIRAWEDRLAFRGEWVQVWAEDQRQRMPSRTGVPPLFAARTVLRSVRAGQVEGLDRDGGLRLRSPEGETFSVRFGEVHLRPV
ncbi:MAG: biotin--[acetyl-CoA-carboxylase] ligase [Anaerolinea sp.]|nr:biotin--[acetyl-CoA-carboxylase] ligase [Anaerolinea sp.]